MQATGRLALRHVALWRRVAVIVVGVPLAGFFAFVGGHKAFAPSSELLAHHAWTAHVPWWIGRPIGWAELASAAALAAGVSARAWPATRIAAAWLAMTQLAAAWIHVRQGETDALGQNFILFAMLGLIAWACSRRS